MRKKLGFGIVAMILLCWGIVPAMGEWVTPSDVSDYSSPTIYSGLNMIDGDQNTYFKMGDDNPAETENCTNYVILDLGGTYQVEGFRFYPRIHATAATGPENLDIFYFANESLIPTGGPNGGYDPNTTASLAADSNIVIAMNCSLPAIHGAGEYYEATFTAFQARYIGLWTHSSYDGGSDGWNTFAEVELNVTPEPATLSLLAAGGLALLRRRKK